MKRAGRQISGRVILSKDRKERVREMSEKIGGIIMYEINLESNNGVR